MGKAEGIVATAYKFARSIFTLIANAVLYEESKAFPPEASHPQQAAPPAQNASQKAQPPDRPQPRSYNKLVKRTDLVTVRLGDGGGRWQMEVDGVHHHQHGVESAFCVRPL